MRYELGLDLVSLQNPKVSRLEKLYNDDNTLMRIIPSLDGSLFRMYETHAIKDNQAPHDTSLINDHIQRIPFNVDDLLKKSIKLNNKITFIGSLTTDTYGINVENGKVSRR